MEKPISCSIKSPVLQKIGDPKVDFHSGCSIIDITFQNVFYVEVQEIHFKNYYTAAVSVMAKVKPQASQPAGEKTDKADKQWKLCLNKFPLMPHAHTDQGAEDYFTLTTRHFGAPLQNITGLRLILYQPSPVWKEFYLDDIRLYKNPAQATTEVAMPPWVTEADKQEDSIDRHLKGVSSLPQLSSDLQGMWALAVQAGANQNEVSLGRYDIEGSYEINLLSYT